jgi:hypothetical protein
MKDPIGDLIEMVRCLPQEAQERFLNHAFTSLGHPKSWPNSSGELAYLVGTVEELDEWIRKLIREAHMDERFIVSGLIRSTIEDQRSYAAPEGRSETVDFWITRVALFKALLALPGDERSKLCPDARLRDLLRHAEDEVRLVDDYADVAQTACEQIEAASAEIFDDAYWREYKAEILRMILGQQPDEGIGSTEP